MTIRPGTQHFSIRGSAHWWRLTGGPVEAGSGGDGSWPVLKHLGFLTKRRKPKNGGRSAQTEARDSHNERSLSCPRPARRSLSTTHAHATSCRCLHVDGRGDGEGCRPRCISTGRPQAPGPSRRRRRLPHGSGPGDCCQVVDVEAVLRRCGSVDGSRHPGPHRSGTDQRVR